MSERASQLSGATAARIIARLTLKRLVRSRGLWVTIVLAAVPILYAMVDSRQGYGQWGGWRDVFTVALLLLAVVPPLHLAPAVAEEVEDHTFTYLWSRPLPRWSVVVGKLLALVPVIVLVFAVALAIAYDITWSGGDGREYLLRGILALAAGTIAAGCVSVGIGSLLPRQALGGAIMYFLIIDLPVGALPFSLRKLAVTGHIRDLAGIVPDPAPAASSLLWLLGISAMWLIVSLGRIRVAEFSTEK